MCVCVCVCVCMCVRVFLCGHAPVRVKACVCVCMKAAGTRRSAHLDECRDLRVHVVIGEVEACPEGAFVQQGVLVELNLPAAVALVQAHRTVREVDHLPQDQLRG